jgi:hypothetical protein
LAMGADIEAGQHECVEGGPPARDPR